MAGDYPYLKAFTGFESKPCRFVCLDAGPIYPTPMYVPLSLRSISGPTPKPKSKRNLRARVLNGVG